MVTRGVECSRKMKPLCIRLEGAGSNSAVSQVCEECSKDGESVSEVLMLTCGVGRSRVYQVGPGPGPEQSPGRQSVRGSLRSVDRQEEADLSGTVLVLQ